MISVFVEPQIAYSARVRTAKPIPSSTVQTVTVVQPADQRRSEDFWTQILTETLELGGNVPLQVSSLVSSAVKWGTFACRTDREDKKLELFRLVGTLIMRGRLRRISRNYVILATEEEQKLYQQKLLESTAKVDFPRPNV